MAKLHSNKQLDEMGTEDITDMIASTTSLLRYETFTTITLGPNDCIMYEESHEKFEETRRLVEFYTNKTFVLCKNTGTALHFQPA